MTPINPENETEVTAVSAGKSAVVKTRVLNRRKVKNGMFDVPEYVAVAAAGAALLTLIFAYFFALQPAREDAKKAAADYTAKQSELVKLQDKAAAAGTTAAGTVDLISTVTRFETNFLPPAANGNAALYRRLNELIRSNGLRNTAGPEYAPLETLDANRAARAENQAGRGGGKQQSLFPGTYVTVTVEGGYANVRHFISDIENTRQFMVINAVEIESNGDSGGGSAESNRAVVAPRQPSQTIPAMPNMGQPGSPNKINPHLNPNPGFDNAPNPMTQQQPTNNPAAAPAKRGSISLQLEMAAYFRRPVTNQN